MHLFLKCILGMKLYMFRTVPLSIIRSFSLYAQQWYMSYMFADNLQTSCQQTCMTYTIAVCTVKHSWWWTEELSKTLEFQSKNKFEKLVHLVGVVIRNLIRCTVTWTSIFECLLSTPYICVFPTVSWPIQRNVIGMYWSQQRLCWSSVGDWSACSRMPAGSCVIICNETSYVRLLIQMINHQLWTWAAGEMVTVSSRYAPNLVCLPCQCFLLNKKLVKGKESMQVLTFSWITWGFSPPHCFFPLPFSLLHINMHNVWCGAY